MATSLFTDFFDGRSLDPDSFALYTEMAMNGIDKFKEMYEKLEWEKFIL